MRYIRSVIATLLLMAFFAPSMITKAAPPTIGGCQIFPADNPWNADVSNPIIYPTDPKSDKYIANINSHGGDYVHPDFGSSDPSYGIPYNLVTNAQPLVPVTFDYDDESDPGPYPIPPNAFVEGAGAGGDQHVLVLNTDTCMLYEMWDSHYQNDPPQNSWHAGSGAIFDLNSNALRPDGWTSADAAGLPILPGLARCDEVMSGEITHALRFTVAHTQAAYVYPATHEASSDTNPSAPPMGLRFRMKADYDLSGFTGQSLVIATALKKYGMMIADNGSNWFISGEADAVNPTCWDDDDLNQLKDIPGTAFEVVGQQPPNAAPTRGYYTDTTPTLTWNKVLWAVQYKVQVSDTANFSHLLVDKLVTAPTLEYTLTNPEALADGVYYWHVAAQDANGNQGGYSPTETFIVNG